VSWGQTESRYDPNYHRDLGYSFAGWGKVGRIARVKGGKRIPLGETYATEEAGLYYLRVDNLGGNGSLVGEMKWLTQNTFDILERYRVFTGDILISIAGTIGRTAVFNEEVTKGPTILTENCAKLHIVDGILPQYLMLLLLSRPLQKQMERDYIQTTIPKLGLDRIRQLRIPPVPEISSQKRVVAEWEAALQKFEQTNMDALKLLSSIDNYLLGELGITLPPKPENTIANRIFTSQRRELAGWRFDPQALDPEREACIAELQSRSSHPLYKAARFCRDLRTTIDQGAIYIGLENIESNTGRYLSSSEKESVSSAFAFRKGQILFPKLLPYLNKVFLAPFDGLCSTEFHVLEGVTTSSEFLTLFLRSQLVVKQTKHLMSGNTLPRLQTEDIEDLLVPEVDALLQKRIVDEASQRMIEAERLRTEAETELETAKRRIEAMLLGEVEA
jgi:restriction endonuclease S subunit